MLALHMCPIFAVARARPEQLETPKLKQMEVALRQENNFQGTIINVAKGISK